ncbi:Six-hairpin glycosidase-like protein [Diplogelasinospora grovesii]|uniref:Six-hairpin glycosidase-like protein n=1 Tax=Diplogelasinospora grovesii TaxID=303347 RepID=A0AAN6N3U2_9PEZI|nr:Six-hairpin glycosidase-like protein [Diplogelasinospora grovesii]
MCLESSVLALCALSRVAATSAPFSEYILTPKSRTVVPVSVYNVNGTVNNAQGLTKAGGVATYQGASAVTYDFGKNVAGIVSFNTGSVSGSNEFIGISFTESSLWINSNGCDATADSGIDEILWFPVAASGSYRAEKKHQRGGFRYLNVYHNTSGSVDVKNLSIYFTAMPQVADDKLGSYSGYFNSDDTQLNRVWYAGAYTNELCTIDPTAGNALIYLGEITSTMKVTDPLPWYLNYTITNGTSALVDGAKRDRLVWPGDMAIAVPSIAVSTYDMASVRNSLDSLLTLQNKTTGALPYAGVPFSEVLPIFSFTYHLYSLIGINDYYLWTGDVQYLEENWNTFKFALSYSLSFVDETGLANVTSSADWLRFGMGGHNIEANAILYYVLNLGISLSGVVGDATSEGPWQEYAGKIKAAAYARLWDSSANLYRDNDTLPLTPLHPQDGNAWAIVANLTTSPAQAKSISAALAARWGKYGAPAPEAGATVSPFISGFELQAHYIAGNPSNAVKLMKLMWGDFMLDDPRMTNSTFIEGYSTNGDLHYAPYTNDPRVSHAHGWATGPTNALTAYTAGLQIAKEAGKVWKISPSLGGLSKAQAGFQTAVGSFSSLVQETTKGLSVKFSTPAGTTGAVSVEAPADGGTMRIKSVGRKTKACDTTVVIKKGTGGRVGVDGLAGGEYAVTVTYN